MMKNKDDKIRKIAKETEYTVSQEYEERIDSLLHKLQTEKAPVKSNGRPFRFSKAAMAACAACAVLVVSVPVAAKVGGFVAERMENMSAEEQQEYVDFHDSSQMTKKHDTESVRYSREFSADEQNRFANLQEKYEAEGLFPKAELSKTDRLKKDAEIADPVYEVWNREIYLPERDLTDEELLEIIDFNEKSAYSVSQTAEAQETKEAQKAFKANPYPEEGDLTEEEACEKAAIYLEAICNSEVKSMKSNVEFVMGSTMENGKYGEYVVTFSGKDSVSYEVGVTRSTGTLTHIWFYENGANCTSRTWKAEQINENICQSVYNEAKAIVSTMYPDMKITGGNCGYTEDKDGNSKTGDIEIDIILENGKAYNFRYAIKEGKIVHLKYESDYDEALEGSWGDYVVISME